MIARAAPSVLAHAAAAAAAPPPASPQPPAGPGLWVAGVTVAVLAQFVSNLGSILQKRSHNDEALRPLALQRAYTKRPLWWIGMCVAAAPAPARGAGACARRYHHPATPRRAAHFPAPRRSLILSGSAADFIALTLAPQSIVATLGCLTLVAQVRVRAAALQAVRPPAACAAAPPTPPSLPRPSAPVIWAPALLGERLSARHYVATALILVGVAAAVAAGPRGDAHLALPALLARFETSGFGGYVAVVAAAVAGLWAGVSAVERRFALPAKPALSDYVPAPGAPRCGGGGGVGGCVDSPACDGRLARFHRVAYGMLSGLAGAQVVLLGKFIGEMAAIVLGGDTAPLVSPALYAVLLALTVVVAGQIYFMNEGVSRFQTLYVLPVFQAVWTLTSVSGGLVVFGEWADLGASAARKVVFPLGIATTLFAVYYLMNTPALPESVKRSAFLDRLFGTERPPPPPPPAAAKAPPEDRWPAGAGAAGGGGADDDGDGDGDGDGVARKLLAGAGAEPPGGDHADVRRRGAGGLDAHARAREAARGAGAGSEQAPLLQAPDEDAPIDWDRTCAEIWALEVAEAGPPPRADPSSPAARSLDALAAVAAARGIRRTAPPRAGGAPAPAPAPAPVPAPVPAPAGPPHAFWPHDAAAGGGGGGAGAVPPAEAPAAEAADEGFDFNAGSPVWSAPARRPQ